MIRKLNPIKIINQVLKKNESLTNSLNSSHGCIGDKKYNIKWNINIQIINIL